MSILEDIVKTARDKKTEFTDKLKASFTKKSSDKDAEYHSRMSVLAQECRDITVDIRYPNQQEFLKEAIHTLQEALQYVLVRDIKNLDRRDSLLKVCSIAAQIEAYKMIMERPQKVLREVEEYQKMIKKTENQ
jgi:hypothetical protein